jgi:hypothetical protein
MGARKRLLASEERRHGPRRRGSRIGRVVSLLVLLASLPAIAAPKLVVATPQVDLGAMTAGETAEAEFSLTNTGTEPLQITEVATTCGCTTTSYPRELKPGETGSLRAKLASNALWTGRIEKPITVRSNDPEQPALSLRLVAQMRPLFQFLPGNPVIVSYKRGEPIRQIVTVVSTVDPPIQVVGLADATAGTRAEIVPGEAAGPGVTRIMVTVQHPPQGGDLSGSVFLRTTHPTVKTVPLLVSVLAQDTIVARPPVLYWRIGSGEPAPEASRVITLIRRSGTFRLLNAVPEHPELQARVSRVETGTPPSGATPVVVTAPYHEVTLRYLGGLPPGATRGRLVITTDDPDSPRLEIPYEVVVEGSKTVAQEAP